MLPLLPQEKKNLIAVLPFPLAYLYQELLAHQSFLQTPNVAVSEENVSQAFWTLRSSAQLLVRLVGMIATSDYLETNKDPETRKSEINRVILEYLDNKQQNWFQLAKLLIEYFAEQKKVTGGKNHISELLDLLPSNIHLKLSPPPTFPTALSLRKPYNWFNIMGFFSELEQKLFKGEFRFQLASVEVINFYIYLLEIALKSCTFFERYGIYVLVNRDERKTRGFICQGTRNQPIGIRGLSSTTWFSLKERPFLCAYTHKYYLSIYPFLVSAVQQHGKQTAFRDLLVYEFADRESISFTGYRLKKLIPHTKCAPDALGVWQKELRSLEPQVNRSQVTSGILNFDELAEYHTRYFVERPYIFQSIFTFLQQHPCGYFCIRGKAGYGKTTILARLYQYSRQNNLDKLGLSWDGKINPMFVWHFYSELAGHNEPLSILKSLYGQILQAIRYSSTVIADDLKKLTLLENAEKSFEKLLEQLSRDFLKPKQSQLVIVIDGLDAALSNAGAGRSLVSCLPIKLPEYVYFLLSWRYEEEKEAFFPPHYQEDRIPLLPFYTAANPIHELTEISPIGKFSFEELSRWATEYLGLSEEDSERAAEILWEKSEQGDPLYLGLLGDAWAAKSIHLNSLTGLPQGRYPLLAQYWESLTAKPSHLGYHILGLLAEMKELGRDDIFAAILGRPMPQIAKERWDLNYLVRYENSHYTIAVPVIREYIQAQFHTKDRKNFHSILAQYYQYGNSDKLLPKRLTNDGLQNLAYHYYHAKLWDKLYQLAGDNAFKDEKRERLKLSEDFLNDIALAMKASVGNKEYGMTFNLSYRYCQVLAETLQGVANAFHIAAQGNYESALEKIRVIRDEQDFFKACVVLLWYALYNEQTRDANLILAEIGRIPDEQISFCTLGMEPFIMLIFQKFQKHAIERIDYLLGKHGFKGEDAFHYLIKIQEQSRFSENPFKCFVKKLIETGAQIISSKEKRAILEELIPYCLEAERVGQASEIWQELCKLCEGITDITVRLDGLKTIAAAIPLENKNCHEYFAGVVKKLTGTLDDSSCKAFHLAQYASLLQTIGMAEDAKKYIDESVKLIEREIIGEPKALQQLLAKLEIYDYLPQEWWERFILLVKKSSDTSANAAFTEMVIVSLIYRGELTKAFKLLEHKNTLDPAQRVVTLKKIVSYFKTLAQPAMVLYWNMLLDKIAALDSKEQQYDLLAETISGLMQLRISEEDPIWNRFVATLEYFKKMGWDEDRDKLLVKLALGLCNKGSLTKGKEIALLLPPEERSGPLSEFAIRSIKKSGDFQEALELLQKLKLQDRLKILACIAAQLPVGDEGRALWKKLTTSCAQIQWDDQEHPTFGQHLLTIVKSLALAFPMDESTPLWEDVFMAIETLPFENVQIKVVEEVLNHLSSAVAFEKTASFWPLLEHAVTHLASSYGRAHIQAGMAVVYAKLGQIWEANVCLEKALQTLEETNPGMMLEGLAKIALGYRELGKESRCREIFEQILRQSGIMEKKKIKHWNPYGFLAYLGNIGLEDLGLLLAEKMLLATVESGDEVPPGEALLRMIELCIRADYYQPVRQLFFRTLPSLPKEAAQEGCTPMYLQVTKIIEKVPEEQGFQELWERAEGMVLNFSKPPVQEQFLENLAGILRQKQAYPLYEAFWEKLFTDAGYVGGQLESLRTFLRIACQMARITSKEMVENKFQKIFNLTNQIASEYDQISLLEMLAGMLLSCDSFEKVAHLWERLVMQAKSYKRQDCQAIALMILARLLAQRAREHQEISFFKDSQTLLEQIPKLQQKCEGYVAVAKEYLALQQQPTAMALLHKALQMGKNLGSYYQNKLLPSVLEIWLGLDEFALVLQKMEDLQEPLVKVPILFQILEKYQRQGKEEEATAILDKTIASVKNINPQYGEQAKMYVRAAVYQATLRDLDAALPLVDKAFETWETIMPTNYQKEAISYMMVQLKPLGNMPELLPIWKKLYHKAKGIEQESYRFWALQELAGTFVSLGLWAYVWEILDTVPVSSPHRANLLASYAGQLPVERAFALLRVLPEEEKVQFSSKLADNLEAQKNLDGLFQLMVEMPGRFTLLCHFTTRAFSLIDKERFLAWFKEIARFWGIDISQ